MQTGDNFKFFNQLIEKIIAPINDSKWFLLLISINILFVLNLHVVLQNSLFQNLINNKFILIPYLLFCIICYYLLFKSKFNVILSNKSLIVTLLILYLLFCTVSLTLLGNLNFIDKGTDNDDALEIFIQSVFQGDYPYTQLTQIDNRITPLPFLPLYSILFFILGNVAYQNFINMAILIAIIWRISKNDDQKIFGYLSISLCIPMYLYIITQSDHLTVATFLLLITFLLYRSKFFSSSVLTGCMIASKGYFWLIVPAIIVHIYKQTDIKRWILYCLTLFIFASLFIIPFILWDADTFLHFAPIGAIEQSNNLFGLKYSNYLFPLIYCLISFICAQRIHNIFLTTTIVYLIASLTLFNYSAMILCFTLSIIGLMGYREV